MNIVSDISRLVSTDILRVQELFNKNLRSITNTYTKRLVSYTTAASSGKRLRPALLYLLAHATTTSRTFSPEQRGDLLHVATALEFFHQASLVHDDIVDRSRIRHGQESLQARFGTDRALIIGDLLLAEGFKLLARCTNSEARIFASRTLVSMCDGELTQLVLRKRLSITPETYISIAQNKTASLFSVACGVGSMIVSRGRYGRAAMRYGINLGIAYQLIDDLQDFVSNTMKSGKQIGRDIVTGDMTLPLIYLKNEKKFTSYSALKAYIATKECCDTFMQSTSYQKTKVEIGRHLVLARSALANLPRSPYKDMLRALAEDLG